MSEARTETLAELLIDGGHLSWDDVQTCVEMQVLHGGDLATTIVDVGVLSEEALATVFAEHLCLQVGPTGSLSVPSPHVSGLLPPELASRHRVFPIGRSQTVIDVGVSAPLHDAALKQIREASGLEVQAMSVLPFRLEEAIADYAAIEAGERERWLVDLLNAGEAPSMNSSHAGARQRVERAYPAPGPYRRMSEHPQGIVLSERQPSTESIPPDTLTGPTAAEISDLPPSSRAGRTLEPFDSDRDLGSVPPYEDDPSRDTKPYADEEQADKRDTQPWRDDDPDDGAPVSVAGEFKASLSDAPPSAEARMLEDHRRFRHRGPFTRPQAELAVGQAADVQMVLEILTRYARQFFERSVLFVVAGDSADLRFAHGVSMGLASLSVSLEEEPSVLRAAHLTGDPVVRPLAHDGADAILRNKLSIQSDERVAAIPLTIRERGVAIFYGDDRTAGVDRDAVFDVTDFIEICASEITRIIISKKRHAD